MEGEEWKRRRKRWREDDEVEDEVEGEDEEADKRGEKLRWETRGKIRLGRLSEGLGGGGVSVVQD